MQASRKEIRRCTLLKTRGFSDTVLPFLKTKFSTRLTEYVKPETQFKNIVRGPFSKITKFKTKQLSFGVEKHADLGNEAKYFHLIYLNYFVTFDYEVLSV